MAESYPGAWEAVARFRLRFGPDRDSVEYSLRRLVEERPFDKEAWLLRAEHAREVQDDQVRIASLLSAVDADPRDIELIREAAYQLCGFLDERKSEIPQARRGVYLAGLRSHMERVADQLDANGLSRLAWLFLLENNKQRAKEYAERGLKIERGNKHCRGIVERVARA